MLKERLLVGSEIAHLRRTSAEIARLIIPELIHFDRSNQCFAVLFGLEELIHEIDPLADPRMCAFDLSAYLVGIVGLEFFRNNFWALFVLPFAPVVLPLEQIINRFT